MPMAPAGFKVQLFATGLEEPRKILTAPNGDFFLVESGGDIKVFRGIGADGKPQQSETFVTGLKRPYGIAFYPPGPDPKYVYVGNTDSIVRFTYHNGDLKARGKSEHIADLPHGGGHWTRDLVFSPMASSCSWVWARLRMWTIPILIPRRRIAPISW